MPPYRNNNNKQPPIHELGISSLKKKIRDIERILRLGTLSAEKRVYSERSLKALKLKLVEKKADSIEKLIHDKYRMVKFFERQKITRKIKKYEKELQEPNLLKDQRKAISEKLLELQADLNYVIHYPAQKKYLSLFPTEGADDLDMIRRRNEIRDQISDAKDKNNILGLKKKHRMELEMLVSKKLEMSKTNQVSDDKRQKDQKQATNSSDKEIQQDDFFV
ncbi:hypothetical protein G9A89_000731 [Geosiphon pyriformis]|nr:hypothetical protein G9A89_000731 [Geosiphon pyriformis]